VTKLQEEQQLDQLKSQLLIQIKGNQDQYNMSLIVLKQLLDSGKISTIDYNQAIKNLNKDLADSKDKFMGIKKDGDDFGKSVQNTVGNAFSRMGDALTSFVTEGKADFASLAKSIIADLIRIAIQAAIVRPLMKAFGLSAFADGGVINQGSVTAFASGGVVSQPTMFPMANGMGLMGEAGPEAIMPLRRNKDGRLGVEIAGGSRGSSVFAPSVNVVVNGGSQNKEKDEEYGKTIAGEVQKMIKIQMAEFIQKEKRQGGMLN